MEKKCTVIDKNTITISMTNEKWHFFPHRTKVQNKTKRIEFIILTFLVVIIVKWRKEIKLESTDCEIED